MNELKSNIQPIHRHNRSLAGGTILVSVLACAFASADDASSRPEYPASDSATVQVVVDEVQIGSSTVATETSKDRADENLALVSELGNEIDKNRFKQLLQELRCMVCQNQSVYDSQAELARDLRLYVRNKMLAGLSDDEIRADLGSKYGEFVLYRPNFSPSTWLLWILPAIFLIAGVAILRFVYFRKRDSTIQADEPPSDGLS